MKQTGLFDARAAEAARDKAIDQVEANVESDWYVAALAAVLYLARNRDMFTTDEVWTHTHVADPHEPRAMGAVMREANRNGWVEATDRTVRSRRVKCHGRPVRVWRSKMRGQ